MTGTNVKTSNSAQAVATYSNGDACRRNKYYTLKDNQPKYTASAFVIDNFM